jgi:uncharacterized membrane protein
MNNQQSLELRAVIAAAVYATLGSGAQVASVEPARRTASTAVDPQRFAWSLEGRRQIHGGHKVR